MRKDSFATLANNIFIKFPTRMWKREKVAFLEYCKMEFKNLGYNDSEITIREDRNILGMKSKNLLVGSPDADVLITAHYDTPGNNGFWMFGNPFWGMLGSSIFLFIFSFGLGRITAFFPHDFYNVVRILGIAIAILFVMLFFIKNPQNRNDNTSGALGVFNTAARIAETPELREKCAFVLFDHEEVMPGLLGSRAFAKWRNKNYPGKKDSKVINFDCIGNGDIVNVMAKRKHEDWHKMYDFIKSEGFNVIKTRGSIILGNSDHAPFRKGVSLLYLKRSLLGPIYIPRIHTGKDTVCDLDKIDQLCLSIYKYICKISD